MGYKILGVTLARSGSKGVKQKNIKNLCGHPLLSYKMYDSWSLQKQIMYGLEMH